MAETIPVGTAIEDYVEQLSFFCVRFKHNRIYLFFQFIVMKEVLPTLMYSGNEFHAYVYIFLVRNKVNNKS